MANEAGQGCSSLSSSLGDYTFVCKGSPASQGGSCTRLAVYHGANDPNNIAFSFFTASGNSLTAQLGTRVPSSSGTYLSTDGTDHCQEFTGGTDFTSFSVTSGWYLGCFAAANQNWATSGDGDLWFTDYDQTENSSVSFSNNSEWSSAFTADITAAGGGLSIPLIGGSLVNNGILNQGSIIR